MIRDHQDWDLVHRIWLQHAPSIAACNWIDRDDHDHDTEDIAVFNCCSTSSPSSSSSSSYSSIPAEGSPSQPHLTTSPHTSPDASIMLAAAESCFRLQLLTPLLQLLHSARRLWQNMAGDRVREPALNTRTHIYTIKFKLQMRLMQILLAIRLPFSVLTIVCSSLLLPSTNLLLLLQLCFSLHL